MVRLREIPRTATFAWSPGPAPPLLATGTKAGAVDADFSNETQLELWELDLDNADQGVELQPVATVNADSRFNDIAWSQPSEQHPRGIIAGALDSGALVLWDAEKLRTGASDALIEQIDKHTGPIKALQFNPFRPHILATAGVKGELYIHDLEDQSKSFRLGKAGANPDDYSSLDWNKKVAHILATGSNGGFVTVWDVRQKKENLTLNNFGRKSVSAVSWDPDVPTRLITAIPTDQHPLVLVWDLRNSNAPEKTLAGHDQGVLSVSWCAQDSNILLSCGKDNRTICWNPHTGDRLGEFPVVTNWTFQTTFNPFNPNLLATASFDGKILIQTLQNTATPADTGKSTSQALEGEDFFSKAHTEPQGASFSLPNPPKWLKRPSGVSFAFGGKLVRFGLAGGDHKKSKISISTFVVDSEIGAASEEFSKALEKGDLAAICESKISKATTEEEKADWTVIETLISQNPRNKLIDYLGFSESKEEEKAETTKDESAEPSAEAGAEDDSFFDKAGSEGNFLSDLAASKGVKTNNPFQVYTGSESETDKKITRALMLGSFETALDICLEEDRLSDAFVIANCGGEKCIQKAQKAYFKKRSDGPNYLRLLASIVGKNLWDVVYNADLKDWKEVMASIFTYADESEFPDLCEAVGDRLEEAISSAEGTGSYRKDASFCYLAGRKLEKVVVNWAQELQESEAAGVEQSTTDNSFSIHARSLQDFIEKVTVFRQVTGFNDTEQSKDADWKLAPLYAKYVEYADVAAAHGQLSTAEKYLDLLPEKYPAADVARNRVKQATRKQQAPQAATQRPTAASTAQRGQRVVPQYQTLQTATAPIPQTTSPYAPAANTIPAQPAPPTYPAAATRNQYMPTGYQPQAPQSSVPAYGGYQPPQHQAVPPPPRSFNASPSIAPAVKQSNIPNWNDTPDLGPPKPASRRGTPYGGNAISSPFPGQQNIVSPPPPGGPPTGFMPQRATPPVAPPPKGPPRMSSPSIASPIQQGSRPSSSAANAYAPPQPSAFAPPAQPPLPRGTSPYNPPPSAAPPSNRYAPAPSAQPTPSQGMAPPPRQVAPPPNPYAAPTYASTPPPSQPMQQAPPPGFSRPPPPMGPPQGPPRTGSVPQVPPKVESRPGTGHSMKAAPSGNKHPAGDRSHIPPASRPIFEILSADMQRVKAKAPAQYKQHVVDTEKRLNILFDHLNNEDLLKPDTIQEMNELAQHLQGKNYEAAIALFTDLMTNKTDEGSNWMVGVKRLIQFSKSTP